MEKYVYIDETGDLGEFGSKYFIITAIWTDNPALFDGIVKKLRKGKFSRELSKAKEIKANKSSKRLIIDVLKRFSKSEWTYAKSIILDKKQIRHKQQYANKDVLYNFVCGHLSNIAIDTKKLNVRIDRTNGKQIRIEEFNEYMKRKFKEVQWTRNIEISHVNSESSRGIQIADVISWAVFQKFEHDNEFYIKLIEKKTSIEYVG